MSSWYSSLHYWLLLTGIIVGALWAAAIFLLDWMQNPRNKILAWLKQRIRVFTIIELVAAPLWAIALFVLSSKMDTVNSQNTRKLYDVNITVEKSFDSLKAKYDTLELKFGKSQKELNALKPLPPTEKLRRLLTQIDPRIPDAIKRGQYVFQDWSITASRYSELMRLTKETVDSEYISVGPIKKRVDSVIAAGRTRSRS